jgi:hypothetical protein
MMTANNTRDTTATGVMQRLNIEDKNDDYAATAHIHGYVSAAAISKVRAQQIIMHIKTLADSERSNTRRGRIAAAHAGGEATCEEEEGVVREKDVDVHGSSTTCGVGRYGCSPAAKERRDVARRLAASAFA